MATQQHMRRLQTTQGSDVDDQAWLVNCALLVLAGSIAGVVIAMSDFADPRLLYNGYVRLGGVGVIVAVLFAAVKWLDGRMLRRVQFCVLVSLLLHFWLDVFLISTYMIAKAEMESRKEQTIEDPAERITVPDYHEPEQPTSEIKSPYEEPVKTAAPVDREPEPVEKKAPEQDIPFEPQKPLEVESPALQQPNPAELRRQELSAPRRDVAAGGQLTRQPMQHQPRPDEPILQPDAAPAGKPLTVPLTPQEAALARQQPQTRTPEQRTFEAPAAEQKPDTPQLARRGSEPKAIDAPSTPEPIKRMATPAELARSEAQPEATRAAQTSPAAALQPSARDVAQRATELPKAAPQTPRTAPALDATVDAKSPTPRRPAATPAASDQATAPRRAPSPALPQPVSEATAEATATASTQTQTLASAGAEVARQAPMATRPSSQPAPASSAPEAGGALAVNQPRRAESGSVAPRETARLAAPRKTAAPSDAPTAVAEAATPAAAASQPSLAMSQPGAATVERQAAASATAAPASATSPAVAPLSAAERLPAVASRRAPARQQSAPGTAEMASIPQTIRRQTNGAGLPSATAALESAAPAVSGAAAASKLEASSRAAAVERSSAAAPAGAALAAAGTSETAVGSAPTPARLGAPRGRGDREPSVQASGAASRPGRTTAAADFGATAAAEPGATPSPIASVGAGQTTAPSLNAQATATTRGGRAVLPASKPTPGSGAAGASGTAGPVGLADLSRVARQEADAAAVSGGGTPKPAKVTSRQSLPLDGPAEAVAAASSSPGTGRDAGSPLEPNVGGQQRQAAGLSGRQMTVPAAGALASTSPQGSALPQAAARRAQAAQPSGAGDAASPNRSATVARATSGIDLPSIALAADEAPTAGLAGVTPAGGSQPSRLEEGSVAAVGRAASSAPVGNATAAGSPAPLGMGVADAPVLPGRARAANDAVATIGAPSTGVKPGRTMTAATIGGSVEATAAPAAAGGESSADTTQTSLAANGAANTVARAAAGGLAASATPAGGAAKGPSTGDNIGTLALARAGATGPETAPAAAADVAGPTRRQGRGVADLQVAVAEADGGSPSDDQPAESASGVIQVAAVEAVRQATGLPAVAGNRAGSAGGEPGPAATTPGLVAGPRRLPKGTESAAIAAEVGGGPVRKMSRPGIARGMPDDLELQPVAAGEASDAPAGNELAMADGLGEVRRREGGLPVQITAPLGPGGMSLDPSPQVGVPSRRARPESELVHNASRRFVLERSGGVEAIDGAISVPMETYSHREIGRRGEAVRARGGSEGTERAVEMGLDFFARMQFPDGHWSTHKLPPGVAGDDPALGQMESDTAATGLALLTYLGGGYTHTDDKHRDIVRKGLDWLVRNQKPNGDLFAGGTNYAWFYSHGMATMALCEGYGMTQDPQLREPARKAVQFIVASQHPKRGGWRYAPQSESDTSVSGWQLQALKSAQMAGIEVPPEAFQRIGGWLDGAQAPGGKYVYNPFADRTRAEQADGLRPSLAMTGEGMLMRMYLGHRRDNRRLIEGADWLKGNLPQLGAADRPQRDCYYWYYGTQAMFQMQGEYWPAWNERMRQALEPTQVTAGEWAGSWHPDKPVRDRWGHAGGRVYVTAMHLLMLEVYYRVLPLYQELTK